MACATEGELSYYLDDFADEILPCGTSLPEWAEWLSKPDEEWRREAARDGDTFTASVTRWAPDIVATRTPAGWTFSRQIDPDAATVAVRFGFGLGWSPDNIIWGENMAEALLAWFAENDAFCDDEEYIAVGHSEPSVRLVYWGAIPPALTVEGTVQ